MFNKKELKTIEIPVPIFDKVISLYVCDTIDKLSPFFADGQLSNIYGDDFMGLCFEAIAKDGRARRVIWIREFNLPVLAHEIYHATKYILDFAGVDDHETGAFLTEYLFSEAIKINL